MATSIDTTVERYLRLPVAGIPSNQPYQTRPDSEVEAAARGKARHAFLEPGALMEWPEIDFPQLNMEELMAHRSMLLGLIEDIEDAPESTTEVAKDAVFDVVTQKLNEVCRHIAVRQRLGGQSLSASWLEGATEEELRFRAIERNLEVFGRPDTARFNWFLAQDRRLAESKLADENPLVREYAQKLLDNTGPVEQYDLSEPVELDADTRQKLKEDLYAIFPGLEEYCQQDFPEELPVSESLPYFNRMLDILGLPKGQYEVYFTNKGACEKTERGIAVGLGRLSPFKASDLIRLPVHEGMHLLRHHNALSQEDPSKRLSTPSNLAFEEAFCVLMERTLIDESYVSGVQFYKSIGLQMSLDKTQDNQNLSSMRSMREVVDILAIADGLRAGAGTEEAFASRRTPAYNRVMRTARGNAMDARDLSYHKGDQPAKQAILRIKDLNPEQRHREIMRYLSARFDPTDEGDSVRFAE